MPVRIVQTIHLFFILNFAILMSGCNSSSQKTKVTIGFSQCTTEDIWREQMLREMEREAALLNDVDFQIILKDAENNSEKQEDDIRKLVEAGIDILIVSPNQRTPLKSIIDSVVQLTIPVILIDRDIRTDLPTYFIGASNFAIGRMAGEKAISLLPSGGDILVFAGLRGSAPAIQRQKGFKKALEDYDNYTIIPVRCDWTEETAYKLMTNKVDSINADLIYAHNDFMARGIIRALNEANKKLPPIIGIDGLNAPDCGIDMVRDSLLAATITYPTGGDVAIQTARKIILNQEVHEKTWLKSILITSENVAAIKLQRNEIEQQFLKIDRQNQILQTKEKEIARQQSKIRKVVLILGLLILFLLATIILIRKRKATIAQEFEEKNTSYKTQIPFQENIKSDERELIDTIKKLVNENEANPKLNVQFVGDKLGMSHSTIYRKTKKATGLTTVELINLIRLNHAAELLKTTNLTVEEIAFQTGFNTASYFSTSFVKQFGEAPARFRRK